MGRTKIKPAEIKEIDYLIGCSVLSRSIAEALKDPKNLADYQAFKKEYEKERIEYGS